MRQNTSRAGKGGSRIVRGIVLGCALLFWQGGTAAAEGDTIMLNLKDADIATVIATVAEMTGKNFIVDPRVKGRVTIISSRPLDASEVYEVFLSVLTVHGFAAIPDRNAIKIVPEVTAKQNPIPTDARSDDAGRDQYVTWVIQVRNVNASQLVPVLRPLLPQEAHLAAYPGSNVLIVSAGAANVERLAQIISRIDTTGDGEVEMIPLHHASAEEVVRVLTALVQQDGQKQPGETPRMVADLRSNSVLLSGDQGSRLRLRALIVQLDTPTERTGNTRVVYLRFANAKDLVAILEGAGAGAAIGEKGEAMPGEKVRIQADENINALVISAPPDVMQSLEEIIRRLDIRRAQVMVEAVIVELTTERAAELGVQWIFDGSPGGEGPVGISNLGGSGSSIVNLAAGVVARDPRVLGDGLTLGIGRFDSRHVNFAAVLRALAADTSANILSTPSLVTMDNQEAEIVVGQNVPFITGSYSNTGTGTTPNNPFQTISRQDIGLSLKIKPQINDGDTVKLEIMKEVSSLGEKADAADIVTNKRAIRTTVMADSGQIIVLGGLIDDQLTESLQKVPGLGDIPGLGHLFRHKRTTKVKRNLMVFLHPVILRDARDSGRVTGGKYEGIRNAQQAARDRGVSLMKDEITPVLPEWVDPVPPPLFEGREDVREIEGLPWLDED